MIEEGFPAYRRLKGGGHYYRITAADRFEELQRMGTRWILHEVHATIYPERLRVQEMLAFEGPFEPLAEHEWVQVKNTIRG